MPGDGWTLLWSRCWSSSTKSDVNVVHTKYEKYRDHHWTGGEGSGQYNTTEGGIFYNENHIGQSSTSSCSPWPARLWGWEQYSSSFQELIFWQRSSTRSLFLRPGTKLCQNCKKYLRKMQKILKT